MAIDIVASAGLFTSAAEQTLMTRVFAAFLAAIDATDDERVSSIMGVALHVLPAERAHGRRDSVKRADRRHLARCRARVVPASPSLHCRRDGCRNSHIIRPDDRAARGRADRAFC